ncbi:RHS repeat domain-containing protein, partial [Epilithonimonas hungarica]
IDVLDRNDYYPFGMNMQGVDSSFDTMGSFLNHKYNRKELQETGFYDYGWRQYMPDLGRWFGMDQLSEKYNSFSPYAYVTNNPAMFYDIDGRDMPGWLQSLWDATKYNQVTTFSGFDSSGSPSSISFGNTFSAENFTSFVNFLQGGGTGNYTFWTNSSSSTTASYNNAGMDVNVQGLIGNNINIKAGDFQRGFDEFVYNTDSFFDGVVNYPAIDFPGFLDKYYNGNLGYLEMAVKTYNKVPNVTKRAVAYNLSKMTPFKSGKIFQGTKAFMSKAGKVAGKLGKVSTALSMIAIGADIADDGNVKTSSLLNGGLLAVGIFIPGAAPFILAYGVLDYTFDIGDKLDAEFGSVNTHIYD